MASYMMGNCGYKTVLLSLMLLYLCLAGDIAHALHGGYKQFSIRGKIQYNRPSDDDSSRETSFTSVRNLGRLPNTLAQPQTNGMLLYNFPVTNSLSSPRSAHRQGTHGRRNSFVNNHITKKSRFSLHRKRNQLNALQIRSPTRAKWNDVSNPRLRPKWNGYSSPPGVNSHSTLRRPHTGNGNYYIHRQYPASRPTKRGHSKKSTFTDKRRNRDWKDSPNTLVTSRNDGGHVSGKHGGKTFSYKHLQPYRHKVTVLQTANIQKGVNTERVIGTPVLKESVHLTPSVVKKRIPMVRKAGMGYTESAKSTLSTMHLTPYVVKQRIPIVKKTGMDYTEPSKSESPSMHLTPSEVKNRIQIVKKAGMDYTEPAKSVSPTMHITPSEVTKRIPIVKKTGMDYTEPSKSESPSMHLTPSEVKNRIPIVKKAGMDYTEPAKSDSPTMHITPSEVTKRIPIVKKSGMDYTEPAKSDAPTMHITPSEVTNRVPIVKNAGMDYTEPAKSDSPTMHLMSSVVKDRIPIVRKAGMDYAEPAKSDLPTMHITLSEVKKRIPIVKNAGIDDAESSKPAPPTMQIAPSEVTKLIPIVKKAGMDYTEPAKTDSPTMHITPSVVPKQIQIDKKAGMDYTGPAKSAPTTKMDKINSGFIITPHVIKMYEYDKLSAERDIIEPVLTISPLPSTSPVQGKDNWTPGGYVAANHVLKESVYNNVPDIHTRTLIPERWMAVDHGNSGTTSTNSVSNVSPTVRGYKASGMREDNIENLTITYNTEIPKNLTSQRFQNNKTLEGHGNSFLGSPGSKIPDTINNSVPEMTTAINSLGGYVKVSVENNLVYDGQHDKAHTKKKPDIMLDNLSQGIMLHQTIPKYRFQNENVTIVTQTHHLNHTKNVEETLTAVTSGDGYNLPNDVINDTTSIPRRKPIKMKVNDMMNAIRNKMRSHLISFKTHTDVRRKPKVNAFGMRVLTVQNVENVTTILKAALSQKYETAIPTENKMATPPENKITTHSENTITTPQENKTATPQENKKTTHPANKMTTPLESKMTTLLENEMTKPLENKMTTHQENKMTTHQENKMVTHQENKMALPPGNKMTTQSENKMTTHQEKKMTKPLKYERPILPENKIIFPENETMTIPPENEVIRVLPENATTLSNKNEMKHSDNKSTIAPENEKIINPKIQTISTENKATLSTPNLTREYAENETIYPKKQTTLSPVKEMTISPKRVTTIPSEHETTIFTETTSTMSTENGSILHNKGLVIESNITNADHGISTSYTKKEGNHNTDGLVEKNNTYSLNKFILKHKNLSLKSGSLILDEKTHNSEPDSTVKHSESNITNPSSIGFQLVSKVTSIRNKTPEVVNQTDSNGAFETMDTGNHSDMRDASTSNVQQPTTYDKKKTDSIMFTPPNKPHGQQNVTRTGSLNVKSSVACNHGSDMRELTQAIDLIKSLIDKIQAKPIIKSQPPKVKRKYILIPIGDMPPKDIKKTLMAYQTYTDTLASDRWSENDFTSDMDEISPEVWDHRPTQD